MSRRWRIDADDMPQERAGGQLRQALPDDAGRGFTALTRLDEGLSCIETRYTPGRDFTVRSRIDDGEPRLVLTLGLEGRSSFRADSGEGVDFRDGHATISAFHSSLGERQYAAGQPVAQVRLAMTRQWLAGYFGEAPLEPLFSGGGVRVLSFRPYATDTGLALRRLVARDAAGPASLLNLHGQALMLLARELEPLLSGNLDGARGYSAREKEMACAAREILWQELQQPPSVSDLARRVGTNTFKLKQLFHHFFGDTPYGVLLRFRMDTAYQILTTTRCPVHIVAAQVGYGHASNFSAAFTRHFGIAPAKVARGRVPDHFPEAP